MKYLTTPLFVLCFLFSTFTHSQEINPNKLPLCPKADYSIKNDLERSKGWHNCWGRNSLEIPGNFKGHIYEAEFKNGRPDGWGKVTLPDGFNYVGEFKEGIVNGYGTSTHPNVGIYVGEFKDNKKNGQGTFTWTNGYKHVGEYKDDKRHGEGIETAPDGKRIEGIWENDKFIREAKVNLPKQNNNVATNTDRSENNSNKLTPCPPVDYSKNSHSGLGGRTEKWNNCFGRYVAELNDNFKGDVLEGEWQGGYLNGWATYYYLANNKNKGDKYVGEYRNSNIHGQGTYYYLANNEHKGDIYSGEFRDGKKNGHGTYYYLANNAYKGDLYIGEWKDDKINGLGILTKSNGKRLEGIFENYNFIREAKVNLPNQNNNVATNTVRSDIDRERQQLAEERRRLEDEKRQRQQASSTQRINLQVNHTQPNSDGLFFIDIKTNADTASLLIDGKEDGGKSDGNYTLKRIARAGQSSSFKIIATDVYGNTDTKTINVTRNISEAKATYADLNPTNIKRKSDRDAVAIIIGIADYKNLPKADFANDDARVFYDYAIRALSIKPENIKLLVDGDASEVGIYKAFKTWLPSKVRSSTDVYVFYSGHGLPTSDGNGLYLLPQQTDRDLISKTAIQMQEVISDIQSTKPKSVTLFLDACYSG